jgi:hypothetical protein
MGISAIFPTLAGKVVKSAHNGRCRPQTTEWVVLSILLHIWFLSAQADSGCLMNTFICRSKLRQAAV